MNTRSIKKYRDEAAALIATSGWQTIEQANWEMSDDRSHGDEDVAEASGTALAAVPAAIRRTKNEGAVLEYVVKVLKHADVLRKRTLKMSDSRSGKGEP